MPLATRNLSLKDVYFCLTRSLEVRQAVWVQGLNKYIRDPVLPCGPLSVFTFLQGCASWFQNGCQSTRHCGVTAGARAGYNGTFFSCACLLSERRHFPRSLQQTSPDVTWSPLDHSRAKDHEGGQISWTNHRSFSQTMQFSPSEK